MVEVRIIRLLQIFITVTNTCVGFIVFVDKVQFIKQVFLSLIVLQWHIMNEVSYSYEYIVIKQIKVNENIMIHLVKDMGVHFNISNNTICAHCDTDKAFCRIWNL